MNETQRLVFKIARECKITREHAVIVVPKCALRLIEEQLGEGLPIMGVHKPDGDVMFAGVRFIGA